MIDSGPKGSTIYNYVHNKTRRPNILAHILYYRWSIAEVRGIDEDKTTMTGARAEIRTGVRTPHTVKLSPHVGQGAQGTSVMY